MLVVLENLENSKMEKNKINFDGEGRIILPQSINEDLMFDNFAKDFNGNKKLLKIFLRVNNLMYKITEYSNSIKKIGEFKNGKK